MHMAQILLFGANDMKGLSLGIHLYTLISGGEMIIRLSTIG